MLWQTKFGIGSTKLKFSIGASEETNQGTGNCLCLSLRKNILRQYLWRDATPEQLERHFFLANKK